MIIPGTLRDYSFIAANMRKPDRREFMCQVPPDTTNLDLAMWSLAGLEAWTVTYQGQPVAALGAHALTPAGNVLSLWLWGSRNLFRVAEECERFVIDECADRWIAEGVTRIEARAMNGHIRAHKWLKRMGFDADPLDDWGRDGENFTLFSWSKTRWLTETTSKNT